MTDNRQRFTLDGVNNDYGKAGNDELIITCWLGGVSAP